MARMGWRFDDRYHLGSVMIRIRAYIVEISTVTSLSLSLSLIIHNRIEAIEKPQKVDLPHLTLGECHT